MGLPQAPTLPLRSMVWVQHRQLLVAQPHSEHRYRLVQVSLLQLVFPLSAAFQVRLLYLQLPPVLHAVLPTLQLCLAHCLAQQDLRC